MTATSVDAVRTAGVQGLRLSMLTYWNFHQRLLDGTLVRLDLQDAQMEDLYVWAVIPNRRFVPPRVQLFVDALEPALTGGGHRAPAT
ncbi:LysR substrate-binding domain-containing protein [Variovorax sp. LARHSF232]